MRLAMILMLFASTALAGAVCPENEIAHGCWPDAIAFSGNQPTGTMGAGGIVAWTAGSNCENGCYDLPAGVLAARGAANTQGGCGSHVRVNDIYTILGPPGPPLAFQALLLVHADLAPFTSAGGLIESGGQSAPANAANGWVGVIPLSHAPGESFLVHAELGAGGEDGAHPIGEVVADGTIRFRGLPPGYSIVSCQNYDVPVPAHAASWGGVKALYR